MKSPFVMLTLSLASAMAWLPTAIAEPVITEIVAINDGSLEDKDGDNNSAWVEIYNTSADSIDLQGHYVTDNVDNPSKYLLPRLTIPGESYGILFLSGKDFSSLFDKEVHASFSFGTNDDYFAIIAPDGSTIIDALEGIENRLGMSYGRLSPDVEEGTLFEKQTPLEPNEKPIAGLVADTKFSVDRGFFTEPIQVEITTATEGARILYTTSGRAPSEGSIFTGPIEHVYDGPITISETTVLRAAAFKDGLGPSNIDTQTYIFASDVNQQEEMTGPDADHPQMVEALTSIPTLSLAVEDLEDVTVGGDRGSDNDEEFETSVELLNPDGTEGFQIDAGVSRFGGYFTNFDKENFRLHFRKRYGAAKLKYPLYRGHEMGIAPAEEFDAINLRSGSHDMVNRGAYMSNRFTDDTLLEMGHIAPHGRFIHVYINGSYWGQYHLRERWNAPMFQSYFGGPEEDYDAINGNNQGPQEFLAGDAFDGNREFWAEALEIATEPNPFANIQNHVDMGSYLAFFLTWHSGNSESEFQAAGSRAQGVPFKFYFKDADGYLRNVTNRRNSRGPGNFFREMNDAEEPDYQMFLADTIHKHYFNDGAFTVDRNIARLQRRVDETKLSFIAEAARWGRLYREYDEWLDFQDDLINDHFPDLTKDMIRAFEREGWYPDITAPKFLLKSGEIEAGSILQMTVGTLFNPQPGDILYTLDGSDPRLSGGAVADGVLTYERDGPGITLEETTTVKARIHDPNGEWSPLMEANFHLGKTPSHGDLVISELHYRPSAPSAAEIEAGFDSRSQFEFVEVYNRSNAMISLTDVVFNDGIGFDFAEGSRSHLAPGELAVIVGDQAAFALRYGNNVVPDGQFQSGRLSNGGETLRLSRRSGEILQELRFDNKEPWPETPDGLGKSLTLKDPTAVPGIKESDQWQASNLDGGTPGALEDGPGPGGADQNDLDGDGLPAFAEAALGTSDADASSGADRLTFARSQDDLLTITLLKDPAAEVSQFQLEISSDLETWSTDGFSLDEANQSPNSLRWTRQDADAAQSFIRLVITAP